MLSGGVLLAVLVVDHAFASCDGDSADNVTGAVDGGVRDVDDFIDASNIPMMSTGRPMVVSSMMVITIPPPGMPGEPTEISVARMTMVISCVSVRGTP